MVCKFHADFPQLVVCQIPTCIRSNENDRGKIYYTHRTTKYKILRLSLLYMCNDHFIAVAHQNTFYVLQILIAFKLVKKYVVIFENSLASS